MTNENKPSTLKQTIMVPEDTERLLHASERKHVNQVKHTQDLTSSKNALLSQLHKALDRNELCVYYQPQICLETGTICGMEALIRWQHPHKGFVLPGEFIPLAEETGFIVPLGEWVVHQACQQIKQWQKQGFPILPVSVNFSARQFQDEHIVHMVEQTLADTQVDARSLKIEVTESAMMNNLEGTTQVLHHLKDLGTQIVLDDFGTHYSSLQYLKSFPLDVIKIDRSFIKDMVHNMKDKEIIRMVIELAHRLGMRVVAEGVETEDQNNLLKDLHCDEAQGFLYGKPAPIEAIEPLLTS